MAKICVITGGTSGIGKCTAEAMAQKGYTVYELSRRAEGLPGMFHIPTDVTDPDACQRAIDEVVSQAGRIDVMINNAGFGISGAIEFTPVEQAKRQFDVNFFGMVNMNRAVIPVMRAQRSGRIVNLSSVAGAIPIPFQAFYSASKAAQTMMIKSLAGQLAPFGITCNSIAPGVIYTDRNTEALSDPEYAKKVTDQIPARFYGEPRDCAGAAVLLCSDAGRYLTGQSLYVDGGKSL